MNMGDIAQKAAVAYLIWAVVGAITPSVVPTTDDAIHEMFLLVNDDPSNQISSVTVADPLNPLNPPLKNIFDAAGAPYPK